MRWTPSRVGGVVPDNDFSVWASAPSEGVAPQVAPTTRINCWEMVMFAAYRAGVTNWKWIHDVYTKPPFDIDTIPRALSGGARISYIVGDPKTPRPKRGDIVFFTGAAHVALANGVIDGLGRTQVISFWPPPDNKGWTKAFLDKVKTTTIEELDDFWISAHKPRFIITFSRPPW